MIMEGLECQVRHNLDHFILSSRKAINEICALGDASGSVLEARFSEYREALEGKTRWGLAK